MRAKCAMYGCKNATYNQFGYLLTFHRFPKNPERLLKWKELCKNPRIKDIKNKCLFLCSHHFDKTSFTNQLLKPYAIPNINLSKGPEGAMGESETDDKHAAPDVGVKRKVTEQKVDSSEENEQGDSSECDESDSSKLLEASEDSNDSLKTSLSWHPNTSKASEPVISSVTSLAPSTSKASNDEDDCSTFAEFLKTRMRKFDRVQKTIAQKLISDILFMADTKQLQLSSIVTTPNATNPKFIMDYSSMDQGSPEIEEPIPKVEDFKKLGSISPYDSDDDSPAAKKMK